MKLVILDRDGVINEDSDAYIKSAEEWKAIPGSLEAIARLNSAGFTVAVATNQSGVGRGLFDLDTLESIHKRMRAELAALGGKIDALAFCPCHPDEGCSCRKPNPGMLLEISERLQVPLDRVPVVGDSRRDLDAARVVGARAILVLTGKGKRTFAELEQEGSSVETYPNLAAVSEALVAELEIHT